MSVLHVCFYCSLGFNFRLGLWLVITSIAVSDLTINLGQSWNTVTLSQETISMHLVETWSCHVFIYVSECVAEVRVWVGNLVVVPVSFSWQDWALEKTGSRLISTFTLHQKMMPWGLEKKATNDPMQLHRFLYLQIILDYVPICDIKWGEETSGEQRADSFTFL